ncbi:hypothetical protein HBA54_04105 [Pelagibius litoralis]|uniref:Calcineurin-like phosphoesterase n=1 Tax=Pelagibius litoralis TaxID=374515 RepID=A0A967C3E5_9PROT|nr:hypothetical protein [Pelagibius litoralis]NIA67765.1 hypothetical protein [Pelagibius litoralis]
MATPGLDVANVTAAVRKCSGVDAARRHFPGTTRRGFRKFCADHGISYKATLGIAAEAVSVTPPPIIQPPKITYRISQQRPDGQAKTRLALIGDAHDSPHIPDKSRFRWFGQYAAEHCVDIVQSVGDLFSLDSLCSYERNDTQRGKSKPNFKEDMASGKKALGYLEEGLGNHKPEKHVTLGNHEDRIFSFSDRTPEIYGMLDENLHTILTDYGWGYSPFGRIHYIGGVGITHVPRNVMGKPYGGMYSQNTIARDCVTDLIYGHTHKMLFQPFWKLDGNKIWVMNAGCALPNGHVEDYAKHSLGDGNWDYGIWDVTIQHGHIQKAHHIPMLELEERYG